MPMSEGATTAIGAGPGAVLALQAPARRVPVAVRTASSASTLPFTQRGTRLQPLDAGI
jgi:hypothetical protein